jgi:hypothetical protein
MATAADAAESSMAMANIATVVLSDIEIGAEDLLKIFSKVQKAAPQALASLGVFAAGVDKAVGDVASGAASPATLTIALPSDISDLKAVWIDAKAALVALGIKL